MIHPDVIGSAAAILGVLCWVPQAVKAWYSKQTTDLSAIGLGSTVVMLGLWLTYGVMTAALPLIVGNMIAILLVGSILVAKLIYG